MPPTVSVTGLKNLDRKLARLQKEVAPKAAKAGTQAALTLVAKGMRQAVNSTDASTALKAEARRAIGSKVRKGGTDKFGKTREPVAKVGFAVGKKRKKAVAASQKARGERAAKGKAGGKGVGVSAQNIHWFVLGTKKRTVTTGRFAGKEVGEIDPIFGGVTDVAMQTHGEAAAAAGAAKAKAIVEKEAKRR
jgi:pyruvate dehydrogenase complex dehydrogenase (E1) component